MGEKQREQKTIQEAKTITQSSRHELKPRMRKWEIKKKYRKDMCERHNNRGMGVGNGGSWGRAVK